MPQRDVVKLRRPAQHQKSLRTENARDGVPAVELLKLLERKVLGQRVFGRAPTLDAPALPEAVEKCFFHGGLAWDVCADRTRTFAIHEMNNMGRGP